MANNLLTSSIIANSAVMILKNQLAFSSNVNRQYDSSFAVTGAKAGDTVNIRKPARYIGVTGPNLAVEDTYQSSIPLQLTTQFHVDTSFSTKDLALSLNDFNDNIVAPAMAAIGNKIDRDGLIMAKNAVANTVGVAGTPPTSLLTYLNAQAYLNAEGTPGFDKRQCVIEPFTSAAIVDGLKGLFLPQAQVTSQYQKGLMGRDSAGMDWRMDQNVVAQTYGAWTTAPGTLTANTSVNAAFLTSGWAASSTIVLANSAALTLQQGDTITIANVFGVNPQNRQSYGKLRNFLVNAAATAAIGTISISVSPAIITQGQFQNVTIPIASATAAVTPFSIAGTAATAVTSPQNLVYHKNAFTLACADLELPSGLAFGARTSDSASGVSIRLIRDYTINNDALPARFDVLYGWLAIYPEMACRVAA